MKTTRRSFILATAGGGAGTLAGLARAAEPAGDDTAPLEADVLVVGGGTAGTIAAIQAGRLGARTVLVESGSQLGGTTTTGGVDFPGLFHAWGAQVIAGIGWDLVTQTAQLNGDPLPNFDVPTGRQHWKHQVRLNGQLYAALAEEACVKAGVQLRYYEFPLAIAPAGEGWRVTLAGKGTRTEVRAKQLVDCTGNASVVGLLGLPRQRDRETQPGTLIYRLGGYNVTTLDLKALAERATAAVRSGALRKTDFNGSIAGFLRSGGENAMHVPGADSSTSVLHTQTNLRGRAALLRMFRFLKAQPGFETLRLERLQPETGVRETFRIVAETNVTVEDYRTGRAYPDAVCHSFYPIDLHVEHGVEPKHLEPGVVPSIPLGALVPKDSRNLLVAGRCLGSDRLANSALRVQASCMAMGQAAGAAAALAAKSGVTPARVPPVELRKTLEAHDAIVPDGPAASSDRRRPQRSSAA